MRYINELPDWWPSVIGLDIETTVSDKPNPYQDQIVTIQAAFQNNDVYIWTEGFENLVDMLEDTNVLKICHNAKFEYKYLKHHLGANMQSIYCTMLMERVLTSGLSLKADLASTAWRRVNALLDKSLQKSFSTKRDLTEAQFKYIENDVKHLIAIRDTQEEEIEKEGMRKIRDLEHDLVPVVGDMELVGIRLDIDAWDEVVREETRLMNEAAEVVYQNLTLPPHTFSLFGRDNPINLNSRQQVLDVFQQSGINVPDTKEETLTQYLQQHPDCIGMQAYQEYVKHAKRLSWDYPKYINPITGRVHTSYSQIGSRTGRFSSSKPNLQNVPRDGKIRDIFIPADGCVFICADYGQQEMRVMAERSGDKNLIKICLEADPHLANARKLFNDPSLNELIGQKRINVKGTGFAMNYGAGVTTFAHSCGLSEEDAAPIYYYLKKLYPGVFRWGDRQRKFLHKNGYVSTIWGRKRWFPGAIDNDSSFYSEAVNTPIQGSSADMIKRAMVRLHDALGGYDARMLLQVHDELIVECKEEQALEVAEIMEQEMAAAGAEMVKSVPCPAEAKIMGCWTK